MNWPWHVMWWLYVVGVAGNVLAVFGNWDRSAAEGPDLVGGRLLTIGWGGFIIWFLTNNVDWTR